MKHRNGALDGALNGALNSILGALCEILDEALTFFEVIQPLIYNFVTSLTLRFFPIKSRSCFPFSLPNIPPFNGSV